MFELRQFEIINLSLIGSRDYGYEFTKNYNATVNIYALMISDIEERWVLNFELMGHILTIVCESDHAHLHTADQFIPVEMHDDLGVIIRTVVNEFNRRYNFQFGGF